MTQGVDIAIPAPTGPPDQGASQVADWLLPCGLLAVLIAAGGFLSGPATVALSLALGAVGGSVQRRGHFTPFLWLLLVTSFTMSTVAQLPGSAYSGAVLCAAALLVGTRRELGIAVAWRTTSPTMMVASGAYLLVGAASTAVSIGRSTTIEYLFGMALCLGTALLVGRTLWRDEYVIPTVLVAIGSAFAASSLVLWLTGPLHVAGRPVGNYFLEELIINGHRLGFTFPRASGPMQSPTYQAITVALGILALGVTSGPRRLLHHVLLALMTGALLLTLARGPQTAFVIAGILFVVLLRRQGVATRALACSVAVVALFVAGIASGRLEALVRLDLRSRAESDVTLSTSEATDPLVANEADFVNRSGVNSAPRKLMWTASIEAIKDRPLLGHGLGTVVEAIAPKFSEANIGYRGSTSHNTYLRVLVETGFVGGITFLAVIGAAGLSLMRRIRHGLPFLPIDALAVSVVAMFLVASVFNTFLIGGLSSISLVPTLFLGRMAYRVRQVDRAAATSPTDCQVDAADGAR